MSRPPLTTRWRALFWLLQCAGGVWFGFLAGTLANVLSALPALAGGGHAVGGGHTNWIPIGCVAGGVVGLLLGGWMFQQSGRAQRRALRR